MKKEIKDYLHLYVGQEVFTPKGFRPNSKEQVGKPFRAKLTGDLYADIENNTFQAEFKLILRPLSDISKEEQEALITERYLASNHREDTFVYGCLVEASAVKYLLKQGFDLFNLHDAGLCLYKSDLEK